MAKCLLDLYIDMNENLTLELKATHYKFTRFLEGAGTRPTMGEAFAMVARISMGIQTEDLEVLAGVNMATQTECADGGYVVS